MNTPVITDQTPKPALAIVERYEVASIHLAETGAMPNGPTPTTCSTV